MPPGSARPSSRAATLTPSPKMSPSSTTMSPTLMPMRNSMRRSGGNAALLFGHRRLHLGRASERVDDAGELDQEAVAGRLDDAAAMAGDLRIDHLGAERLEPAERAFLVGLDQPRVAGDIGREDRREPTFDASWPCGLHGASPVADNPTPTRAPARIKHEVRDRPRSVNIVVFQSLGRADFVVPGASIRCFFGRPVAV